MLDFSIARERHPPDPAAALPAAGLDAGKEREVANEYTARFDVRMTGVDQPVGALSGGNQQKVVLAKWLASKPGVLILDEPTRGIDIGAKVDVHRIISDLAGVRARDRPHLERPARGPRDVRPDPRPPRGPDHGRDRRTTQATEERVMFAATGNLAGTDPERQSSPGASPDVTPGPVDG